MSIEGNQSLSNGRKTIARREFLARTGLGLAGAGLIPGELSSLLTNSFMADPGQIAMQLYTVREQIKADIASTLKKVKSIGFNWVETAFWPDQMSVKQAAAHLKDAGLSVCSCHIELPVADKKEAMLEIAKEFNCKNMIWHGWPEDKRYSTLEGTKELAGIYNEANHFARANGLRFGLHNHWWEYRNRVGEKPVYQVLLENIEPDIFFEMDTYWVKTAGYDPSKIVAELGKRAEFLHIKDGPARWSDLLPQDKPEPMVAVGKGSQDFPSIVHAANGNTKWMVVEMDVTATDVFDALRDSFTYLTTTGLAKA